VSLWILLEKKEKKRKKHEEEKEKLVSGVSLKKSCEKEVINASYGQP
jgi:hypothetical protein